MNSGYKSVIVWPEPPSETKLSEAAFIDALRKHLRGRVERAYIFGSFGTPDFGNGSDVDLILVKEVSRPFWERAQEFEDLYDLHPRIDLLVYSPEELDGLLCEPSGFWKSVKASMRQILPGA